MQCCAETMQHADTIGDSVARPNPKGAPMMRMGRRLSINNVYIQVNASAMVQYDTSRQDSHSLSRKPKVGDVRTGGTTFFLHRARSQHTAGPSARNQQLHRGTTYATRTRNTPWGLRAMAKPAKAQQGCTYLAESRKRSSHTRIAQQAGHGV